MKNARKQRDKQRAYTTILYNKYGETSVCPNCGQIAKHYVPPSLGEMGFFTCQSIWTRVNHEVQSPQV